MFHSLRSRLAVSHFLPILILTPLLSLLLLYQLERRYFLETLAHELAVQADLIAAFTGREPLLWRDPILAAALVQALSAEVPLDIALINSQSRVLATNVDRQGEEIGSRIDDAVVQSALTGRRTWTISYPSGQTGRAIDVAVPVFWTPSTVGGVVRLSYELSDIQERIYALRWIVLLTIFAGALLALMIGLLLARSLAAPLVALTKTIGAFSPDKPPEPLNIAGPQEIKSLAQTFYQQAQRLHDLERTRSLLLSGIVHELGRPLGAIKLAAQTIAGTDDLELARSLAQGIDERVDVLLPQLDDLALLGEIEVQGLHLQCEPVELGAIIETQCRFVANLAANKGVALHCEENNSLPVLWADARRLGQIIGNLLHNAIKYTPAGGEIIVTSEVEQANGEPERVAVRVHDSGPGIDPAERERIFQFFYRNPAQRRIHQGMGLGLALARQLAEAHGGTLSLESEPGTGTTFVLRLPLSPIPLTPT